MLVLALAGAGLLVAVLTLAGWVWFRGSSQAPRSTVSVGANAGGGSGDAERALAAGERPGKGSAAGGSSGAARYLLDRKLTAGQKKTLARLGDAKVPLEERKAEIERLVARGDEDAARTLMAAGSAEIYVNRMAVEGLGALRTDRRRLREAVRDYLTGRLRCSDAVVVCAAVRALARQGGEEVLAELSRAIRENHVRPDGHQDMVCTSVVEALGGIATPKAVPVLAAELRRPEGNGWSLEYASSVIAALGKIGTPEARAAAGAYAERLEKSIPADPMARSYYARKIAEARRVAAGGDNEERRQ